MRVVLTHEQAPNHRSWLSVASDDGGTVVEKKSVMVSVTVSALGHVDRVY